MVQLERFDQHHATRRAWDRLCIDLQSEGVEADAHRTIKTARVLEEIVCGGQQADPAIRAARFRLCTSLHV